MFIQSFVEIHFSDVCGSVLRVTATYDVRAKRMSDRASVFDKMPKVPAGEGVRLHAPCTYNAVKVTL